jgi:hypothetical protein
MADISKLKVNETTYNIKDSTARSELQTKVSEAPFDGAEYVRKNGSWALSSGAGGAGATSAIYFYNQTVNVANNAEILRITDSSITPYIVVLECTFANPSYITSDVTWTSYNGYISFTGTCTAATTANVTLGILADGKVNKSGDTMTGNLVMSNSKFLFFKSSTTDGLQNTKMYLRPFGESHGNNFTIWYEQPTSDPHGAQLYQLPEYDTSLNAGTDYYFKILTSRGGALEKGATIISDNNGSNYWNGRDNASFIVKGNVNSNAYFPALSIKAKTSSWEIGTNGEDEYLQFNNISDANYSTSTNTPAGYFRIKPNGYLCQPSLHLESTVETTFKVHNTSVTLGTAPSSDSWIGGFAMYATDTTVGYLESHYDTSRNLKLRLTCRNKKDGAGSNLDNYIELIMSNSGVASIDVSHPQAWVKELFSSNLTSTAKHLVGITSSYADSGYITLPLPIALGGIGGTDSGWKNCNISAFASSGAIKYRKIGFLLCVCVENLKLTSSITAGNYLDCGAIIPNGYRPSQDLYLNCFINTSSVNVRNIPCRITQNGIVYLYANKIEATPSDQNICGSGVGFI